MKILYCVAGVGNFSSTTRISRLTSADKLESRDFLTVAGGLALGVLTAGAAMLVLRRYTSSSPSRTGDVTVERL